MSGDKLFKQAFGSIGATQIGYLVEQTRHRLEGRGWAASDEELLRTATALGLNWQTELDPRKAAINPEMDTIPYKIGRAIVDAAPKDAADCKKVEQGLRMAVGVIALRIEEIDSSTSGKVVRPTENHGALDVASLTYGDKRLKLPQRGLPSKALD